jgi:hypothetical protein
MDMINLIQIHDDKMGIETKIKVMNMMVKGIH